MTDVYKGCITWIEPIPESYVAEKFEVAARALIVHEDRVLLVYEADTDTWFTPGGRLTPSEELREACLREIDEETGLETTLGELVAVFNVMMPRNGYIGNKLEFIFAATPVTAPDFVERDHVDSDQSGPVVSKLRWFTEKEVKALPRVFPDFLRNWPDLLERAA